MSFDWTEERVELLKKLWTVDGLSAAQIGKEFGITRNASIGKIKRLGLIGQGDRKRATSTHYRKLPPTKRGTFINATAINHKLAQKVIEPPPPKKKVDPQEPPSLGVTIANLCNHHCRWVDNEGLFCGHNTTRGSHCEYHASVVYREVHV